MRIANGVAEGFAYLLILVALVNLMTALKASIVHVSSKRNEAADSMLLCMSAIFVLYFICTWI